MTSSGEDRRGRIADVLRIRPLLVVLGALTVGTALWCCATSTPQTAEMTARVDAFDEQARLAAELQDRAARITAEIAKLGPDQPWAGEYYVGDGLGMNVTMWLAPDAGCVARWTGCLGLYGANWGTVKEHEGRLSIAFERPNSPGEFGCFPTMLDVSCIDGKRVAKPLDRAWSFGRLREDAKVE